MNEITRLDQLDLNASYSYVDYLKWKLQELVELIKGKIIAISPAPARLHQKISLKLTGHFLNVFSGQQCELYVALFDVRFSDENGNVKTVIQPDLCVICDQNKLDDKGYFGAPDLVVEILSPGTQSENER